MRLRANTTSGSFVGSGCLMSLSQNHPFVDGNKRAAFAATYVFLLINELRIVATDEEAQAFILDLYDSDQLKFHRLQA